MIVAGVQMACVADKDANLDKAESYIRKAAAAGARLVCLQELFGTLFFPGIVDAANFRLMEGDDGPTMQRICALARSLNVWIAAGLAERDAEVSGRYFNSELVVDPSGEIVGRYRKTFIPLRKRNSERYYFTPGNVGVPVFDVEGLRVAFNICYDRHFPELARIAALEGAHLLVYPTAALGDTGRINTWRAEMISRAGENVFYVMGVGRCGVEEGRKYSGQSMIVDPYGTAVAELGVEEEGLVVADIFPTAVEEARFDYAHLRDLRPDVYRRLLELTENRLSPVITSTQREAALS
jgi:N-carbamoylputrescine amidase